MKILHISSSYWPAFEFGGPIKSTHEINKQLVKKGIEVIVYSTNAGLKNKNIVLKKEIDLDGVKIFYFPYYGYIHFNFSPALFLSIMKNIKNFDLIHVTGIWNFPIIVGIFWARFYKKPYIISPRGSLMKEPLRKKSSSKKKLFLKILIKRYLKNAAAIHFTVEKEREEYLNAGLPMKKSVVIPNSIKFDAADSGTFKNNFKEKFKIHKDAKVILFMGRLHKIKGLDTLIPAFAEVVKEEPSAVLVLAGPDESDYKKEIELEIKNCRLKIGNKVIFTGMIVGDDKIAAYRESDVFVLPSYSENFGMAVVEAMVVKLPVVITKGVGISNEVEKVAAGLVVEKDVNQVSEAILKILNNPDLAKKMGENGRKLVETEFSSEKVAERFIKEYNEILKEYEK